MLDQQRKIISLVEEVQVQENNKEDPTISSIPMLIILMLEMILLIVEIKVMEGTQVLLQIKVLVLIYN